MAVGRSSRLGLAGLTLLGGWVTGCAPGTPGDSASAAVVPGRDLPDPIESIRQWRRWRVERRYRLIEAHIEPGQRKKFIDTLICVDLFLSANRQVQRATAEVLGQESTAEWDLSVVGEHLGLFSDPIDLIRAEVNGRRAKVTYQSGGRLPLESAWLEAASDGWVHLPGAGYSGLPAALHDLATTLSDIAARIRRERLDRAGINQEFRLRVWPRLMKALSAVPEPADDPPQPG